MSSHLERYSGPSRFVHWAIAFLILLVLIPVGLIMTNLPDGSAKNTLYELHKSFGMTVFALAVIRVAIRAVEGFPPLPSSLPAWQQAAARGTHLALFALIFIVPALGFAGTSMCCSPVNYFWLIPIPIELPGGMDRAEIVLGLAQGRSVPDGGYPVPARWRRPLAPPCAPRRRLGAHGEGRT